MNREPLSAVPVDVPTAQHLVLDEIALHQGNSPPEGPLLTSTHPLHGIKAELQVCVGYAQVTVGDLLNASEQKVVLLDRTPDHPVDLLLNGQVVARGQLVAVDGYFAVRITELPAPLSLSSKA
jgi:flagellar motor switch protein FliN/FliY